MTNTEQDNPVVNDAQCDTSRKLSFLGRGLKLNEAADCEEIITELNKGVCSVTVFEMSGNTLGISAAEALGKALEKQKTLERCLWSDMFTGRLKTEIAPALECLSNGLITAQAHLVEIDLSDNAFGPNGVVGITKLLADPACFTLQELKLNNNGLGHQGCRHLVEAIKKGYQASLEAGQPLKLKKFTAGRNRLENFGVGILSEVFADMGSLEELSLPQNGIGIHGQQEITQLVEALAKNTELRLLNLSDNSLTAKGASSVAKLLPLLPKLEVLDLNDCLLRSSGGLSLAKVFENEEIVPNIRVLNLGGNELNKESGMDLVLSLALKESLESVDLNYNEFGEMGCEALMEAMKSIDKLSALGSLDDDEGSEEEDLEDEDVEDVGEDEEEEEEEEEENVQQEQVESKGGLFNCLDEKEIGGTNVDFNFATGMSTRKGDSCVDTSKLFTSLTTNGTSSGLFSSPSNIADWSDNQASQVLEVIVQDPDDQAAWRRLLGNVKESTSSDTQLGEFVQRTLTLPGVQQAMQNDHQLSVRTAFKMAVQSTPSSTGATHILRYLLKTSPHLTANAILVELGMIKGEDCKKRRPLCPIPQSAAMSYSEVVNAGLRLVRAALQSSESLPRDVSLMLWTLLKNRGPSDSPVKPSPSSSGEGARTTADNEMEALLLAVEHQMGGLELGDGPATQSGDKRAD